MDWNVLSGIAAIVGSVTGVASLTWLVVSQLRRLSLSASHSLCEPINQEKDGTLHITLTVKNNGSKSTSAERTVVKVNEEEIYDSDAPKTGLWYAQDDYPWDIPAYSTQVRPVSIPLSEDKMLALLSKQHPQLRVAVQHTAGKLTFKGKLTNRIKRFKYNEV